MNINDINYIDYGSNKKGVIILLHGWGQNIEMMDMLGHPFEKDFRIIVLDLPGFGKSKEPDKPSGVEDYGDALHNLLLKLKVKEPILIGHSFGGRISIYYAAKYGAKKVVLLASPFRPSQNKKVSAKVRFYKCVKNIKLLKPLASYLKNKIGSSDYRNASEINRGTLVKTVNFDLSEYARQIKCPTLMIYSKLDTVVPVEEARVLERLIPDAGLVEYETGSHFAYIEQLMRTLKIIDVFLR